MKSCARHPLRTSLRLSWLIAEFVLAAFRYAVTRAHSTPHRRAIWLQRSASRVLRIFCAAPRVAGEVPSNGLLVCNHLSYLDVLVLAALTPCVFVAKSDVRRWPVFGWFARLAGTVFVERERRFRTGDAVGEIERALDGGALVVLFPEGTSSGGDTVLPFKSSLLEPAARSNRALTAGLIAYELADGDVREEVCYWRDMTLAPHLMNLLAKQQIRATVRFARFERKGAGRKELATRLRSELLRLKQIAEMPPHPGQSPRLEEQRRGIGQMACSQRIECVNALDG